MDKHIAREKNTCIDRWRVCAMIFRYNDKILGQLHFTKNLLKDVECLFRFRFSKYGKSLILPQYSVDTTVFI